MVGPSIPVGNGATAIAITPDGAFAYVVNVCGDGPCFPISRGTVSIISTSSNIVTKTVTIGYWSNGIAITPDGSFAYVANQCGEDPSCASEGTVSVIRIANEAVVHTIPVGQFNSEYVAISPDGGLAYVSNTKSNTVSIIDTPTNSVVGSPISVGYSPASLAVTPDGMFIYVTNQGGDGTSSYGSVSVIATDTKEVIATVPVGMHPGFLAIKTKAKWLFAINAKLSMSMKRQSKRI